MNRPLQAAQDGGRYRAYCDDCGRNLAHAVTTLAGARKLADIHVQVARHPVRIEPADSYALIELVTPRQ